MSIQQDKTISSIMEAMEYLRERLKDDPSDSELACTYGEQLEGLRIARELIFRHWPEEMDYDTEDDTEDDQA